MISNIFSDLFYSKNLAVFFKSIFWFLGLLVAGYFLFYLALQFSLGQIEVLEDLPIAWLIVIAKTAIYLSFVFLIYLIAVPLFTLILALYSGQIFNNVNNKHYQIQIEDSLSYKQSIWLTLKTALVYLLLMLVCLPLLFVPLVGSLVYLIIFFVLFRKLLLIDLFSNITNDIKRVKNNVSLTGDQAKFIPHTIGVYLLTLIPLIGFLVPYVGVIIISHLILDQESLDKAERDIVVRN